MVTLALLGDVMLGRGVNTEVAVRPPASFWGDALPLLGEADAGFANLECALTPTLQRWQATPKVFYFRADPGAVAVLQAANIRYVSLANNHTLDYGYQGLRDTIACLDAAGIAHSGAGETLAEAQRPALVKAGDLTVGVIAATDNEPPFAATADRPGTHYLPISTEPATLAMIAQLVAQAREAGAALVVLSLHWGPNMVTVPPPHFRAFARAVIDGGIDIVYGHSAHVFQGVERYRQGLILYDTGDALDDYAVDPELRNDWSFLFFVEVAPPGKVQRLRLVPLRLAYARTGLAHGEEAAAICARMTALSAALGTRLRPGEGGLVLPLA